MISDEINLLPKRTLREMQAVVKKAGRIDAVRKILGSIYFSTLLDNENLVTLKVHTKEGILTKSCTLDDFPSDEMIAWLMLIGE